MLYISFNASEQTIRPIDGYFDYNYYDEWLEDDLVIKMIKDMKYSGAKGLRAFLF